MAAKAPRPTATPANDRLDRLERLRDQLTDAIAACDNTRDLGGLAARLMDALEQIADIRTAAPPMEGTPLDELRKRREQQSASAG